MLAPAALLAQEAHPLTGTWTGDYGVPGGPRTHVTVIMNWDGKKVTGIVNPGPNSVPLGDVSIDFATWTVRIEVHAASNATAIIAEGKLEDLASAHRSIRGTFRQGAQSGDFRLTRD
jgi:hypothetical protein